MATIEELNFKLILDDAQFNNEITEVTNKAKKFNTQVSDMLGTSSGTGVATLGKRVAELARIRQEISDTTMMLEKMQKRLELMHQQGGLTGADLFRASGPTSQIDELTEKLARLKKEEENLIKNNEALSRTLTSKEFHDQSIEALQLADAMRRQAEEAERLDKAQKESDKKDRAAKLKEEREQRKKLAEEKRKTLEWEKKIDAQFAVSNKETQKAVKNTQDLTKAQAGLNFQFDRSSRLMRGLTSLAATYLSIAGAERLARSLVSITGEFEMQRTTLRAILKDIDGADRIFENIKQLAVISPFTFKELISYTKQLSAFSVPIGELYDTTKMLADVSAGLGVGMDRLILAYGQIRSAGVLRGQELRQLTEAGVPVLYELKKAFQDLGETAITTSDIFDKISTRQVPFEMIAKIFSDMTSEGGKFYRMQEVQAATLQGKLSNLKDAYQLMFSAIGEKLNPAMKAGVDWLRSLAENYESVGRKIANLVIIYGTYRTTLAAVNMLQRISTFETGLNAIIVNARAAGQAITRLKAAYQALTAAQAANNVVSAANIYAAIAAAVAAAAIGVASLIRKLREQDAVTKAITKANETYNQTLGEENAELELLFNRLKNATKWTSEYYSAKKNILSTYDKYLDDMDRENLAVDNLADVYEKLTQKIRENAAAKAYTEGMQDITSDLTKQQNDIVKTIAKSIKRSVSAEDYSIVAKQLTALVRGDISEMDLSTAAKVYLIKWRNAISKEVGKSGYVSVTPNIDKAIADYSSVAKQMGEAAQSLGEQLDILYGVEFTKPREEMAKWKESVEDVLKEYGALGKQLKTDDFSTQEAYVDELVKKYNEAGNTIRIFGKTQNAETKAAEELQTAIQAVFKEMGVNMKTWQSNAGSGGASAASNPLVHAMEQRIQKLQELQGMYKSISKYLSDEAINKTFGTLFTEGLDFDKLTKEALDALDAMGDEGVKKANEIRASLKFDAAKKELEDMLQFQQRIEGYVEEQRSIEQKISDLNDQKEKDLAKLTPGTKEYAAVLAHYTEELSKLQEQLLEIKSIQMTDFWQELTGADNDYNYKRLERLYDRLKEIQGIIKALEPIKNDKGLVIGYRLDKSANMSEDLAQALGLDDKNDVITLTISQFQQLQKAIGETTDKMKNSDAVRTYFKLLKDGSTDSDKLRAAFRGVAGVAKSVVSGIGEIGSTLSGLGESTDNRMLKTFGEMLTVITKITDALLENETVIDSINAAITKTTDVAKGIYNTADIITLVIKAAVFAVDSMSKLFKENYDYVQMAKKAVDDYRSALDDLQRNSFDTLLGTDKLGLLGKNFEIASKAAERLNKILSDAGFGAGFSNWYGTIFGGNIRTFDELVARFDLLKEDGTLDFEKLAAYADVIKNAKVGEIKKSIQDDVEEILKAYEEWKSANDALRESFKELFHDMSGDIVDDLLDNFNEIGDAVGDLEDMFEDLGTVILRSLLNSLVIKEVIDEYESRFTDAMMKYVSGASTPEQLASELGGIANEVKDKTESLGDAINAAIQAFVDNGLYATGETSDSKTLGNGIKSITEDTANLLASYINAIRADVSVTRVAVEKIAGELESIMGDVGAPTLAEYMMQIQANTYNNAVAAQTILERLDSTLAAFPNGGRAFNVNIS